MALYKQGTRGTVLLTISAIANLILAFANFLLALALLAAAPIRQVHRSNRFLYLNHYGLDDFGMRRVLWVALIMLFFVVVFSVFMAILCLMYRRRTDGSRFLAIASLVLLIISLTAMVVSRSPLLLIYTGVWLLTLIGSLLSMKPRKPGAEADYRSMVESYDPGILRQ